MERSSSRYPDHRIFWERSGIRGRNEIGVNGAFLRIPVIEEAVRAGLRELVDSRGVKSALGILRKNAAMKLRKARHGERVARAYTQVVRNRAKI